MGSRPDRRTGRRTVTDRGPGRTATAGPGLRTSRGAGRRIITDAGTTRTATAGLGIPRRTRRLPRVVAGTGWILRIRRQLRRPGMGRFGGRRQRRLRLWRLGGFGYPYIGWYPLAPYAPYYPWYPGWAWSGYGWGWGGWGGCAAGARNVVNVTQHHEHLPVLPARRRARRDGRTLPRRNDPRQYLYGEPAQHQLPRRHDSRRRADHPDPREPRLRRSHAQRAGQPLARLRFTAIRCGEPRPAGRMQFAEQQRAVAHEIQGGQRSSAPVSHENTNRGDVGGTRGNAGGNRAR